MSYLDKVLSINEKLQTQYGKPGKLSKSADRHTTNPGESKKQHRDDATKFAKKHKKMASDVTPQTGKIPDHTEYKRIGALMAEALGHRVDEVAPIVATVGRLAAGAAKQMAKKKAMDMAADKMKKKKPEPTEESYIYPYYMLALHLAEAADEGFVKSPLAKRAAATSGAKRVSDVDKPGTKMTSDVKRIAKEGNKIVSKKVGAKTNVKTDAALQIGQRARRAKNRKAGVGMPAETPDIARADRELDKKKMAGPEG